MIIVKTFFVIERLFWVFIVGEEFTWAVLGYLNDSASSEGINETNITLIAKVKNPTCMTKYRPISLCNVLCKIILKTLTNRFQEFLGDILTKEQTAFISGQLITDNAIIGFDFMHALKRKKKNKEWLLALKLDMSKFYDRVE